jgi:hypothetical protein
MRRRFAAAPTIVAIAVTAWFGLGFFIADPTWVFLPLWGLYPGECSFWGTPSHLASIYAWVVGAVAVFVGLALLALFRNNLLAAAGFTLLLLVSAYVGLFRAA